MGGAQTKLRRFVSRFGFGWHADGTGLVGKYPRARWVERAVAWVMAGRRAWTCQGCEGWCSSVPTRTRGRAPARAAGSPHPPRGGDPTTPGLPHQLLSEPV
ncbi:hypothetical protein Asi03nite_59900 [Actinoplanes siamensis]|uniref:Uncharacterized protein n=1 Tax=Actinoplanes siamensis TaxID=1223317 RepID=A0A919TN80_9ACTN|nr:hypothetical protein Asi03nite_59900 [Actinoplanes siamensis]